MKNRCICSALACVGAVIGAGFASGREVISFFTRYDVHSWWLILLSAITTTGLCALCMRNANGGCATCWCDLYRGSHKLVRLGAQLCATLLMAVVGGAMISASGHMVAMLWPSAWAYPIGAVGTMLLAWRVGFGGTKPLTLASAVLGLLFMLAIFAILASEPRNTQAAASLQPPSTVGELVLAGINAVAYAAMNLTIALGVICRCAGNTRRYACRVSVCFGLLLVGLLFVSNYLYLKHPELSQDAFAMVRLLSGFGRAGFIISVTLMYLAVVTTLVATLCTLRNAVEQHEKRPALQACVTLGLPLCFSLLGFSEIVNRMYAPAGICCLLFVFAPVFVLRCIQRRKAKRRSPKAYGIGIPS
ncbi:MAG: hypothetical protein RR301_02055 [Clostridia bacterium]